MSDNWVVQNLENALDTWNEKLAEIWLLHACEVAAGTHHADDKEQHEQGKPYRLQRPVDVNDDFPYRTALKGFGGFSRASPYGRSR